MEKLTELPKDLPIPVDDGACAHLLRESLPSIALSSTQGGYVNLSAIAGHVVIYCYPMTGQPGISLPDGWNANETSYTYRQRWRDCQSLLSSFST